MDSLEKITSHTLETKSPDAIILHGSRARKKEREHSDWDIVLLYVQPTEVKNGRELFEGQNIEYSVHVVPIEDIFGVFGAKLQNAIVLFEKGDIGSTLLNEAKSYYEQGVHWPQEKVGDHRLWLEGRIQGMADNIDKPLIFHKYFTDFYSRIYNYWYWLKQHRHSEPIYIAVEEIAEKDPVYYKLVTSLVENNLSLSEKLALCRNLSDYLFESQGTLSNH